MAGKTSNQKETLDEIKTQITVEKFDPLDKRVCELEKFKNDLDKNLHTKIQNGIHESTGIQGEVKNLIWQTVKDKIVWFVLGAAITLGFAFAQGYFSELGRSIVTGVKPPAAQTTQGQE